MDLPPPFDILPPLAHGALVTVELTLAAGALGLMLAFVAGLGRLSKHTAVRLIIGFYVELFRGSSALVQLFWFFYVLPFIGISLSPFVAGLVVLGLNSGAFGSEIVRGAVMAVPKEQTEAALALNMSPVRTMRRIILPQAIPMMLPPFGNSLINLLKGTSLVSFITIADLTYQGLQIRQQYGRSTEVFVWLLILYFGLAYPATRAMRWLEAKVRLP